MLYLSVFFILRRQVLSMERKIIDIFLKKTSKIPALIEVMRPFVAEQKSFDSTIELHMEAMMQAVDSLYSVLAINTKIEKEYSFLMKLSVQIAELQKNEQFLYIRDFIMQYEREMRAQFAGYNVSVQRWNRFVSIKNYTLIWLFFPGSFRDMIEA